MFQFKLLAGGVCNNIIRPCSDALTGEILLFITGVKTEKLLILTSYLFTARLIILDRLDKKNKLLLENINFTSIIDWPCNKMESSAC